MRKGFMPESKEYAKVNEYVFDEISFMKPVFTGDELKVDATVIDKNKALKLIRLKVVIRNQNNQKVSKANMKVLVMK